MLEDGNAAFFPLALSLTTDNALILQRWPVMQISLSIERVRQ